MTVRHVWRLARRPVGDIADDDLRYVSEDLPGLRDGQFLLRVRYLSLDPAQRGWMGDQESYMPPVAIGAPMRGGVAGVVVRSRRAGVVEGDDLDGAGIMSSDIDAVPHRARHRVRALEDDGGLYSDEVPPPALTDDGTY